MTLDSICLVALAAEIRSAALGRRLGEVVLPAREQAVIGLPDGGLFLSIRPDDPRCGLIDRLPRRSGPEPGLSSHLNSLLRGGEVTRVEAMHFDRIVQMDVANRDRVGRDTAHTVILELMGKHSACCVVDADGLIAATFKTVTHVVNRHREILPKVAYTPPPDGGRRDPRGLSREEFVGLWPALSERGDLRAGWRRHLHGGSEGLFGLLSIDSHQSPDTLWSAWRELADRLDAETFDPCLLRDQAGRPLSAYAFSLPGAEPAVSLSAALEVVAAARGERLAAEQRRDELRAAARKALGRIEAQLASLAKREQRAADSDRWQLEADLILSNLYRLPPRAEQLVVEDWPEPGAPPVIIALDPAVPPTRAADALYDRVRKARRAIEGEGGERQRLEAEQDRLRAALAEIESGAETAEPAERGADRAAPARKPRTERERWLQRLRRQTTSDGYTVVIGGNATESEGLLSRVAAPTDIWLHVRGAGSGHVIIRTEGQPDRVPARTIQEAAVLAARQSKMKHSDVVPVVYTQRKYVTKVTGGAAGKVVYRNEKTIFVDPTGR